ncbi:MAG TPA: septum formation family protein [Nocardioidaceae bacterium]|nr:septum formation family protein [Nocardioidaceae bacterium]
MLTRLAAPAAAMLLLLTACGDGGASGDEAGADTMERPELGACRVLEPEDIAEPDNAGEVVPCGTAHTAETFAVGTFPADVAKGAEYTDPDLGAYVYESCSTKFEGFLGGDESAVMRSMLTWAWFRPSEDAWERGARWYRCDVVAGTETSEELRALPRTAEGVLLGRPDDDWMMCANGETVAGSDKVPCSQPHEWRAVTTIKVGREDEKYPGDRLVEVRSRDFCSDSVGAWMNYPVDYEFGYTFFREPDWKAGNRRSICWARTDK